MLTPVGRDHFSDNKINNTTHKTRSKSYKVLDVKSSYIPKVISIWIIRNKVTHASLAKRLCPIDEASVCLKPNVCTSEYTELVDKMRIIFVHLYRFKNKQLADKVSILMQNLAQFFTNVQDGIDSTDYGMNRAQYLWIKLLSNNEVKARINAIEKYELCSEAK